MAKSNWLKVFFLVSIIFCGKLFSAPVDDFGRLHICRNQILNEKNKVIQLRGMSLFWSQWSPKFYNVDIVKWLIDDWKVNVIRIPVGVEYGGYITKPDTTLTQVKTVVEAAISNGIYVIIDWHDHNATAHINIAKKFFKDISTLYGNKPNIIYEIFNEPIKQPWDTVKNYAISILDEIRKVDTANIVIVGTPFFCQKVDEVSKSPILSQKNIAYAFHFYASDKWHQQSLRAKADTAIKNGLPLFVTECGVSESNGNGTFNKEFSETWFKWLEDNKLSWCVWAVSDKEETCSALKPNANPRGGWKLQELNPSGVYIRNKLRLNNAGLTSEAK